MTTDFNEFHLHPQLVQAVTELGFSEPTPIQIAVIPLMLTGQDIIGQAQTGTGKTAAFALPILQNLEPDLQTIQNLVVVPTRELALQVANAITDYSRYSGARVLAVYGGQAYIRQINRLKKGVDIVVGTPGRILDLIRQKALVLNAVRTVVLDEADEMLSMGFIEDIEAILSETPPMRQTALFSATVPAPIRRLADRYMRNPHPISMQSERLAVQAIEQRYYLVNESEKLAALTRLFEIEPITSALIFVRTRTESGELANELTVRGFPAEVLNGDLTQEARERVMLRFRQNQIKVLVATDVAARGLDIEDISHVFNIGLPDDDEIYVHRIGRTGRAGKTGIAISLIAPREQWRLRRIEAFAKQKVTRLTLPTDEEILAHREGQLLKQMDIWLKRARYRRERELVDSLVEAGHDPLEIAAAAIKIARAEEKQRPIDPVSQVQEGRSRGVRHSRNDQDERESRSRRAEGSGTRGLRRDHEQSNTSHEEGMVRLSLSKGRMHGVRPSEVVSTIATHANIPGSTIGKIHIQDRHTLVDVPEQFAAQVLAQAQKYRLQKQPVQVELASTAG
jgi:ATP-dependent RNA helicase DeaD